MSDSPYSGSAVKRSAGHFLVGKIISALLTFAILLWLVRLLSVSEYSAYITLVASLDVALIVASIGLPWIEARYIPEFRLNALKMALNRFIAQLFFLQLAVLAVLSLLAWWRLDWLLSQMNMSAYRQAALVYLLMLMVDGSARRVRDSLLSALLLQGLAQIALVSRNAAFVLALCVLKYSDDLSLLSVVTAELGAALLGWFISLFGLWRYLYRLELDTHADWHRPAWSTMWVVARDMYMSEIITQVYSSQVFTLVIRYSLGEQATAVFGFLRNIYAQVMNYLPAALLFGLIRPKLVASYVGEGGIVELTHNANVVGKFSLFVLMPLLVFTWLTGEVLLEKLSDGKFLHTGFYLAGLLCALIPLSQRQILETVAVVTSNSHLCNYASILGIITLPVTYSLIQLGFDLWSPIIAITLGNILFCTTILRGVAKTTGYRADFLGFYKMLLSALLAYLGSIVLLVPTDTWLGLAVVVIIGSLAFLLTAAIIKPFSELERTRINQFIKRDLFIW